MVSISKFPKYFAWVNSNAVGREPGTLCSICLTTSKTFEEQCDIEHDMLSNAKWYLVVLQGSNQNLPMRCDQKPSTSIKVQWYNGAIVPCRPGNCHVFPGQCFLYGIRCKWDTPKQKYRSSLQSADPKRFRVPNNLNPGEEVRRLVRHSRWKKWMMYCPWMRETIATSWTHPASNRS